MMLLLTFRTLWISSFLLNVFSNSSLINSEEVRRAAYAGL